MSIREGVNVRVAFMCVQNAGRSQMATAFAEQERASREWEDSVEILTGGTHPADHIHNEVVTVMHEKDIDTSDRRPKAITTEELEACDYVATMGCSTLDVSESEANVDIRDWALNNPAGKDLDEVRAIRDDIQNRVELLFDEIEVSQQTEQANPVDSDS